MSSPCDTCPKPGACCRSFALSDSDGGVTFWDDQPIAQQWAGFQADRVSSGLMELPFEPLRPHESDAHIIDAETGRAYSTWRFGCPKLGADGRCTIYETRPQACREYLPGSDALCILNKHHPEFQKTPT